MIAPGGANNQDTSRVLAASKDELDGDAAETAEIGVQRVALAGVDHARERAGQHQMPDIECDAVLAELIGKPGDAERRMAEHAGSDAGLLDLRIAIHDAADPAQIDIERTDRPAADHDAGGSAVVGNGVENLARVLQARIDDFDFWHAIFGGGHTYGQ